MKPYCHILSNGLEVVFIPNKSVHSATIYLDGIAGSIYELPNEIGSAHLLEHLILSRDNYYGITRLGGRVTGVTSREDVLFIVKVLQKDLTKGLSFLADSIKNIPFDKNSINKQKTLVKQEIVRSTNTPEKLLLRTVVSTLFPNGRMAILNTGEIKHIEKLKPKDLKNFKDRLYTTQSFKLFIYGNFDKEKVFKLCEKYFGKVLPNGPASKNNKKNTEETKKKAIRIVSQPQFKQTHLRIDFYGRKIGDKEAEAHACLMEILEHQLHKTLAGLVQKVICPSFSSLNYGISGIYIVAQEKDIKTISDKVEKCIAETKTVIKDDFVAAVKNQLIAGTFFSAEKPSVLMDFYSQNWLFGNRVTTEQEVKKIKSVTTTQVMREYQYIFGQKPKITVLSEKLGRKTFEKFLK